mgnify:CR=1 FL=1
MREYAKQLLKKILPDILWQELRHIAQRRRDRRWLDINVFQEVPEEAERATEYQHQAEELFQRYKRIEFVRMIADRFGDSIQVLVQSDVYPSKQNELTVYIPIYTMEGTHAGAYYSHTGERIPNPFLLQKIGEKITLLTLGNDAFYKYLVHHYRDRVYVSNRFDFFNMLAKSKEILKKGQYRLSYISLSPKEKERGEAALKKMGIQGGEYICFFARSPRYLKEFLGQIDHGAGNIARNSSIKNFVLMSKQLWEKGIHSVRLGYLVEGIYQAPGAIDYANEYHSDFLDVYLSYRAKFFVSGLSAVLNFAALFSKPVVMVNVPVFTFNADGLNYCKRGRDLLLPKKMYDTKAKRYLTFREIFAIERRFDSRYTIMEYYQKQQILLEENTPEEIAAVAEEMRARLDGECEYTKEDEERQKKFRVLLLKAAQGRDCFVIDIEVSRDFLRMHEALLV